MRILITGGTGFIGGALTRNWLEQGHEVCVLSRNPDFVAKLFGPGVAAIGHLNQIKAGDIYDVVINLAGAPIFGARWTNARKKIIKDSRIGLTGELVSSLARMAVKPGLLISGSAVGFYGDQGDTILTEQSAAAHGFSHDLCAAWEAAAKKAEQYGIRVCVLRTGLVIGQGGGLLQRMLLPFRLGLGGCLGSGKQWMSWIHRDDWIQIVNLMITDQAMCGVFNAVAPKPVTNREFTDTLAGCLKRPALFPAPSWLLEILLGEMSELVLGSQRIMPERLLSQGFSFQYEDLAKALEQAISRE